MWKTLLCLQNKFRQADMYRSDPCKGLSSTAATVVPWGLLALRNFQKMGHQPVAKPQITQAEMCPHVSKRDPNKVLTIWRSFSPERDVTLCLLQIVMATPDNLAQPVTRNIQRGCYTRLHIHKERFLFINITKKTFTKTLGVWRSDQKAQKRWREPWPTTPWAAGAPQTNQNSK